MTVRSPRPPVRRSSTDLRQLNRRLDDALRGHVNAVGEVTVSAFTTTTTVRDPRVHADSIVLLGATDVCSQAMLPKVAVTSKQGADYTAGGVPEFTLSHPSFSSAHTFEYLVIG